MCFIFLISYLIITTIDITIKFYEVFRLDIKYEKLMRELESRLIELEEDKTLFHKFNIFETLRITNTEIRHSNVLGWLLDPKENHNLKGLFLKEFIRDINESGGNNLELDNIYFDSFEVLREWNNIDILVISKTSKILLVIENKIWSEESSHQLSKYRRIAEGEFNDFTKLYVFLTPYGEPSSDPEVWVSYDYERVLVHLDNLINRYSKTIDKDVLLFIEHYTQSLRRNIVGDKILQDLCLDIYNKHKEAFDLIISNLPNQRNIYQSIIIEYLESRSDVVMDESGKTLIRFITNELDSVIPKSPSGWTKSGRIFLFEIENFDAYMKLKSVVGPSLADERNQLLRYMNQCSDKNLFKDINLDKQIADVTKQKYRKFSHVNGELIIDKTKYDVTNESQIREMIYEKMDELFETYIKKVNEYLLNFSC